MFPLTDANPIRRFPAITCTLIAINALVFLYEVTLSSAQLGELITNWGVVPARTISAFAHPLQVPLMVWESLITAQFLHSGWLHIIGNMLFLWVFGDNVEDFLGPWAYLCFYLASGIVAAICQAIVLGPTSIPSIGASGAIAGVLGAYIVLYPQVRVSILVPIFIFFWAFQVPAFVVIGWWFIQQFFYGIAMFSEASASGIAFWAHIGGFIFGIISILPFIGYAHSRHTSAFSS